MPVGELVITPLPTFFTVSWKVAILNVAVTDVFATSVNAHEPVPLHPPPLHPANVDPVAGFAASVTLVPASYVAVHVEPQSIPTGELITIPLPVQTSAAVSV